MKLFKHLLFFILLCTGTNFIYADEIILIDGIYQAKNLYVINPFAANGVGSCVQEVVINGNVIANQFNPGEFVIDLSMYQFRIGDPVEVKIIYKERCSPKVLNPQALTARGVY